MKNKRKELLWAFAFVLTALLLTAAAARALRDPYLAEPADSLDYLYLGSSYTYCDVDPARIYAESGLTGYIVAGPEQPLAQTCQHLKEALKTQKPGLVILEATGLHFEEYQPPAQSGAGLLSAGLHTPETISELRLGFLTDLYLYHSRWKDVGLAEVLGSILGTWRDPLKGFLPVEGTFEGIEADNFGRMPQSDEVYQQNLTELLRIAGLCAEAEVPLAVVLHPSYSHLPLETRETIRADLTEKAPEVRFWDWSEDIESLSLVPAEHFYDPGHLNQDGAEIFSRWLGHFLVEEAGLRPRTQTADNAAAWAAAAQAREGQA